MILILLLAVGPTVAPLPTPDILGQATIEEHLGASLPTELRFTDENGHSVRFGDLAQGKPTILILAYFECPMLCGLVLRGVVDTLKQFDGDLSSFRLLTVSFNPADTPERAARKRTNVLAEVGRPSVEWPFLVGEQSQIQALTDALGFRYAYDARSKQFAHPSAIVLLTPDGRISRYLYGVSYPPKDLKLALMEANAGRSGPSLARILMTCFRYDPNTNRYGPYLVGFFRLGSTLVLLSVALSLWLLRHREKAARG